MAALQLMHRTAVNPTSHVRQMASYNQWMNEKLYAAAATLPGAVLAADRKAFFGSILGTLNHVVNGDLIWLKRFAAHPANHAALAPLAALPLPAGLNEPRAADLAGLAVLRNTLDATISRFADAVSPGDLGSVLAWTNRKGELVRKEFGGVLLHFFNHQTHHRGQVTTLLSQEGVDVGDTDLLLLLPDAEAA
jgi:uncharacterized damage-inducible protein DinB